ncbi:MAG: hypothetical protein R3Y47_11505 [Lachnospiraceae bacterium]
MNKHILYNMKVEVVMKKKILLGFCTVVVILIATILFITNGLKHTIATGICLVTDNSVIVIVDDSPMEISDQSSIENMLVDLQTGDKVIITHDGVQETYPARTGVYKLLRIDTDSINEVSPKTITQLVEMGYIAKE